MAGGVLFTDRQDVDGGPIYLSVIGGKAGSCPLLMPWCSCPSNPGLAESCRMDSHA